MTEPRSPARLFQAEYSLVVSMRPAAGSLLLLLLSVPLFGEAADVRIETLVNDPLAAGSSLIFYTWVSNRGPDTARNVVLTMSVDGWPAASLPCPNGECVIGDMAPNSSTNVRWYQITPAADLTFTVTLSASSDTPDPDRSNNTGVTRTVRVSTAPRLEAHFTVPVAHQVVATIDLPPGAGVKNLPPQCSGAAGRIRCTVGSLEHEPTYHGAPTVLLSFTFIAPPQYEGVSINIAFEAHALEADLDDSLDRGRKTVRLYRTFLVTSTADDGGGSLRAAILAANAACPIPPPLTVDVADCAIQFNIDEPSPNPWKTIRVKSELPHILAWRLHIDGATQSAFSGTTNAQGPAIEISGAGTVDGNGLFDDGSCARVITHLAINGFLGNGIAISGGSANFACDTAIAGNYIGTDPTGSVAIPNDRGIGSVASRGDLRGMRVQDNVISGNTRSGMFLLSGGYEITGNRIGLDAHRDTPLPNGRSGIFVYGRLRIGIQNNVIAFNREMGVAIDRGVRYTEVRQNAIWGNGGLAIDDGLDGASPSVAGDNGDIPRPFITSASYDPTTNTTTILGAADRTDAVEVFASDSRGAAGSGDAQHSLGRPDLLSPADVNDRRFVLRVKRDLRGQWISASATRISSLQPAAEYVFLARTGELSAAVAVQ